MEREWRNKIIFVSIPLLYQELWEHFQGSVYNSHVQNKSKHTLQTLLGNQKDKVEDLENSGIQNYNNDFDNKYVDQT